MGVSTRPTSYSQSSMADRCWRMWYFSYVKKIPTIQDLSYADAGNVLHKTIEHKYTQPDSSLDDVKKKFNQLWIDKKLDSAKWNGSEINLLHNQNMKAQYWLMVLNALDLNIDLTSVELKILADNAIGFIDGVNTTDDIICDWKSSTRRPENEKDYTTQMLFYSYLYSLKFGRLPKKATVYYLKYPGSKGEFTIHPTEDDMKTIKKWHRDIRRKQLEILNAPQVPPKCETCYMFCPYKNICDTYDTAVSFELHYTGNFIQMVGDIPSLLYTGIDKKFSYELKNSHLIKKARPNANTTVRFFNPHKQTLPIGFKSGLLKTLSDYAQFRKLELQLKHIEHRTFDTTTVQMPDTFLNGKVLRDYQKDAVDEFLTHKIGVIQIGTGGGKTEVAIECIRRLGVKTLFIVDRVELLMQTKKRIEDSLGIQVGQIGSGEDDIQDITVATVQTLYKHIGQYSKYLQRVRFTIFDEVHKIPARSYWRISQHLLGTTHRLGMSGTAFRDDGNDMYITAISGDKIVDLSASELIANDWLIKPKVIFIKEYMGEEETKRLEKFAKEGLINEKENYMLYYITYISANTRRNEAIHSIVKGSKRKQLLLVKLVQHGIDLEEVIPGSKYLHGSINKKERKQMFDDFSSGKLNVLISTISIFSEGIDIPSLDMVINASGNKGDVKTIQILGRILRKLEGKENAQYIDFIDESRFFKRSSNARKSALRKEGHDVEVIPWEKWKMQS